MILRPFTLTLALALAVNTLPLAAQEISPVLFGQNHWLAQGDEGRTGYLHLLWPKVQAAGVQLVRIGGNGYEVTPPSLARWTAMVDSVQSAGAEPLVQIPRQATAEQAVALVNAFNRSAHRPVRYWSIGNEPTLHDKATVDEIHAYVMRLAPAMRATDPTIKIFVCDEAWMRPEVFGPLCGGRLDVTGQDASGRWLVDGFTYHSYPFGPKFTRQDVIETGAQKIRGMTQELLVLLEQANRLHGRTGAARLSWGLTEVNVTYANPNRDVEGCGNPSFLAGQFLAEIFGLGMEFGAFTVAPWAISETDNPATDFGFLGLPPDFAPRSSYYHEQMLARNFRGRFLATRSSQPHVKTIGCVAPDRICVLLLNEELDRDYAFDLALDASATSARDLVVHADAGVKQTLSGTLSAQSTQLYVFDAKGRLLEKTTYSVLDNLKFQPPTVQSFR